MSNLPDNNFNKKHNTELDLQEFFFMIWNKKIYIGALTFVFALISILYALRLPDIYKSEAIIMPVASESRMSGMLGQYSGIASIAGVTLPDESGSKSQEALARIQSFEFFSNHFLPNIKIENLLALKKWNRTNNTFNYDESIFNSESNEWVRKIKPPRSTIPSSQEGFIEFQKILNVKEDKSTLFISLSIEHVSPLIAKKWIDIILDGIDQVMRDKDEQEAVRSIEYLNGVFTSTGYEEIKKTISSLQQEQMKKLMMVQASENYVFKVLDSPIVPEIKSKPNRAIIVILGSIFGMFVGMIGAVILSYSRK